ncbi:MAG: LacI family transcriptional regulator [Saprospiraceae bacterium]|jgi:LacI family transcriptional regulator
MAKSATLKDIAKALNVSVTTVSRALNDKDDISRETKNAVIEVAKMIGYKPNYWARQLSSDSVTNIIGVVLPRIDHYFYSSILEGVMNSVEDHSHYVLIGESQDDAEKEAEVVGRFTELKICGLILAPAINSSVDDVVSFLQKRSIDVVVLDRVTPQTKCSHIINDDFNAAKASVRHLFDQGYRRIAHIRGPKACLVAEQREQGYKKGIEECFGTFDEKKVKTCSVVNIDEGYQLMKELYDQKEPPDAVFCVSDEAALGVYKFARERGINIPNDLGIVGFSNSLISQQLDPDMSTIDQFSKRMGTQAARIIIDQLPGRTIVKEMYESQLIIRKSSQPTKNGNE